MPDIAATNRISSRTAVSVGVLATAAIACAAAGMRGRRRGQTGSNSDRGPKLVIPEIRGASAADLLAAYARAQPLKLPGLAKPLQQHADEIFGTLDATMVYPGNRIGVERLFRHISLQSLLANIRRQLSKAREAPPHEKHPLLHLADDWWSEVAIQRRKELHQQNGELYGMAAVATVPDDLRARLEKLAEPVFTLTTKQWKSVSSNLWVGASSGSLHYDERDNVLLQLCGTKRVVLFPIEHTPDCRLHGIFSRMPNHSSYNQSFFTAKSLASNPKLARAGFYEVILNPGDALVIPAGVMHAPLGSLDSVSLNAFVKDGPLPSVKSRYLRFRFHLSVTCRSIFSLHLPHIGGGKLSFAAKTDEGKGDNENQGVEGSHTQASMSPKAKSEDGSERSRMALVTGASQGIGLALCEHLVDSHATVVALCRAPSKELVALQSRSGDRLQIAPGVDLLAPAGEVSSQVLGVLGDRKVSLLINSAGQGSNDTIGQLADEGQFEASERLYRLNCLAPLALVSTLANRGCLQTGAKVVLLSSSMGSISLASSTPQRFVGYRLSKSALNMGSVLLANHLKDRKITVAAVHPGATDTAMTRRNVGVKISKRFQSASTAARNVLHGIGGLGIEDTGGFWVTPTAEAESEALRKFPW